MAIGKRKMPALPTKDNLAEIYGMLGELNTAVKAKNTPATRAEVTAQLGRIVGLVGSCKQLGSDAKDPAYLKGRLGACTQFYEAYNKAVDDYNEKLKDVEIEETPSSPEKVVVNGDTSKYKKLCGLPADMDDLINEMKKPLNYAPTKVKGQYTPKFNKHETHITGGGNEWKAYVEKGTTNSVWRLYFVTTYKEAEDTLEVKLTKCQKDH